MYNYITLVAFLILAMILSYVLEPTVNRLQRMGVKRTIGITLTLSVIVMAIVFFSTNVVPIFVEEMLELTNNLNIETIELIAARIETRLVQEYSFIPEGFLRDNMTKISEELFDLGKLSTVLSDAVGVFTNIFSAVLVVPFAAFFFLKDGSKIRRDVLQIIPNKYFETTLTIFDLVEKRLGLYFRIVSVGISVGIANTIPYFGPIIGYVLSIIISIVETGDFSLVLYCVVAIFIVQMIDNLVLQPYLFSKSADMHPVAILFIILIGAETAGILGMLIAIPLATTIRITIKQIIWSFNNYQIFRLDQSKQF
jgi:predicted PurR-regulated permease PerM